MVKMMPHLSRITLRCLAVVIPFAVFFSHHGLRSEEPRSSKPTPTLPVLASPITKGKELVAFEPPSDDEILVAWGKVARGLDRSLDRKIKFARISVDKTKEKSIELTKPVRFVPLIGNAIERRVRYRCKIHLLFHDVRLNSSHDFEFEQMQFHIPE